jgi:hypothetical protein
VGLEHEDAQRRAKTVGDRSGVAKNLLMPPVNPVEIAERHDGAPAFGRRIPIIAQQIHLGRSPDATNFFFRAFTNILVPGTPGWGADYAHRPDFIKRRDGLFCPLARPVNSLIGRFHTGAIGASGYDLTDGTH